MAVLKKKFWGERLFCGERLFWGFNFSVAAVSINSIALVWVGRIGSWGDGTGFIK